MRSALLLAAALLAATPAAADFTEQDELRLILTHGHLGLLEKPLPRDLLLELEAGDLRLLRNTVFAKHGRRFASKDLQQHFARFEWYKPRASKVTLQGVDQQNVRLIQDVEQQRALQGQLLGVWHASPVMASGWSAVLIFRPGYRFESHPNSMDCAAREGKETGRWEVRDGKVALLVETRDVVEGGALVPATGSCASDHELQGGERRTLTLDPPVVRRYALIPPEKLSDPGLGERVVMKLDHHQWFHWSTDPGAYP